MQNPPFSFPKDAQRTGTILTGWSCMTEDGGDHTQCVATVYAVPQCGINDGIYNEKDVTWKENNNDNETHLTGTVG